MGRYRLARQPGQHIRYKASKPRRLFFWSALSPTAPFEALKHCHDSFLHPAANALLAPYLERSLGAPTPLSLLPLRLKDLDELLLDSLPRAFRSPGSAPTMSAVWSSVGLFFTISQLIVNG